MIMSVTLVLSFHIQSLLLLLSNIVLSSSNVSGKPLHEFIIIVYLKKICVFKQSVINLASSVECALVPSFVSPFQLFFLPSHCLLVIHITLNAGCYECYIFYAFNFFLFFSSMKLQY